MSSPAQPGPQEAGIAGLPKRWSVAVQLSQELARNAVAEWTNADPPR